MEERQCTRENILAIVPRYDRWTVKGEGELDDFCYDGDMEADTSDIEEYYCGNCGEYFTPTERYSLEALDTAWQAALAHLPNQEAA